MGLSCFLSCLLFTITKFLGSLLALRLVYEGIILVGKRYLNENTDHLELIYGKGTYAVVTGGSSGIGLEFAKRLASAGFNIVNISRSKERLRVAEEEIKKTAKYPDVDVISIEKDFSGAHRAEFFKDIEEVVEGLDISILVNNVGMTKDCFLPLPEAEYENLAAVVAANCNSQLGMLRTFLPKLSSRASNSRLKSAVIDVSSIASLFTDEKMCLYGATKLFNKYLTNGLYNEIEARVDFLSVQPFLVRTNMTKPFRDKGVTEGFIEGSECVSGALSNLGRFKETPGGKGHLMYWYKLGISNWMFDDEYVNYFLKMLVKR